MNRPKPDPRILIRGANDVGSTVAHRLFAAGYSVVIHEVLQPTTTRRKMSFTDAVFDEHVELDGVEARLIRRLYLLRGELVAHQTIPIVVKDFHELRNILHPQILVDARMRKHLQPENQRSLAEFTIGLGPNFIAGETVDVAIETNWGDRLGQIIEHGETNPLQGDPREIEGHARDRYVYAPVVGTFYTAFEIGDHVSEGQEVAQIDSTPLFAPITGIQGAQISGIGERPARIADGVITAIQNWKANHVH